MRKYLSVLLVLLLLLCACGKEDPAPSTTAEPALQETESTTAPTVPETTVPETTDVPTVPETTVPDDQYSEYYRLLNDQRWIYRSMGVLFDKPQDIDLKWYFYSGFTGEMEPGFSEWKNFSEEETAYLEGKEFLTSVEVQKMPAERLESIMQDTFGISLSDVRSGIPERWAYYEETGCYYSNHGDYYGPEDYTIIGVQTLEGGVIRIYYELEQDFPSYMTSDGQTGRNLVLTLRFTGDGTYRVLSNQFAPEGK